MKHIVILLVLGFFSTNIILGQSFDGLWISSYSQENDAPKKITYFDFEKEKVKTKRNPVDYDTAYHGNFGLIDFRSDRRLVYIDNGTKQYLKYKVRNGEIRFRINHIRYRGRIDGEKLLLSAKALLLSIGNEEIYTKAEPSRLVLTELLERLFFSNSYWKIKSIDEELDFQMDLNFRDSSTVMYSMELNNYKFSEIAWAKTYVYNSNLFIYIMDGIDSYLFVFNKRNEESIIGYTTIFKPLNYPQPNECNIQLSIETLPDSIHLENIKNDITGKWKSIEYCDQIDTSWIGMGYPFTPFNFEFNADNTFSIFEDSSLNRSDSTWRKLNGSWELDQTGRSIKLNVPNEHPRYIFIDEINGGLIKINHQISFITYCDYWNNSLILKNWP